ncbi:hypothetical protein ACWDB3_02145, partial [Streptomyces bacillaris]
DQRALGRHLTAAELDREPARRPRIFADLITDLGPARGSRLRRGRSVRSAPLAPRAPPHGPGS